MSKARPQADSLFPELDDPLFAHVITFTCPSGHTVAKVRRTHPGAAAPAGRLQAPGRLARVKSLDNVDTTVWADGAGNEVDQRQRTELWVDDDGVTPLKVTFRCNTCRRGTSSKLSGWNVPRPWSWVESALDQQQQLKVQNMRVPLS